MLTTVINQQIAKLLNYHRRLCQINNNSLQDIITHELFEILQPTISMINSPEFSSSCLIKSSDSLQLLMKIAERRVDNIASLLLSALDALDIYNKKTSLNNLNQFLDIRPLAGDSHNGGFRPIYISSENSDPVVLKFTDPRPYKVLAVILKELSESISIDLEPPAIFSCPKNQWYIVDYLKEDDDKTYDTSAFMFSLGSLTAVAFCLGFVDLHLENIVVSRGRPLIVDPECIFYHFDENETASERLLSTGLLSHNVHMSAMRGGCSLTVPLHNFSMYQAKDGTLRYRKPVNSHRNKLPQSDGLFPDPANYRREIIAGYCTTFKWFARNADQVSDIIQQDVADDFRIRFLARKTRHYASVIYMLNLPNEPSYERWVDHVLSRFRSSGHFPSFISAQLLNAEIKDLKNRDIPYFWMTAGGNGSVEHKTGSVQQFEFKKSLKEAAIYNLQTLHKRDLREQIAVLNKFLDIDISA